jgi:hypothetical protein
MKTEKSYKLEIHLDEIFDNQPISLEDLGSPLVCV